MNNFKLIVLIYLFFPYTVCANNITLYQAVIKGDVNTVTTLALQGVDINHVDDDQNPLLNHAIHNNQYDMVKQLVLLGADVNQTDKIGWTPLIVASTYGYNDIAKLLIKHDAKIDHIAKDGVTALSQASLKHNKLLMHMLIQHLEIQQHYNLSVPANLTYQLIHYAKSIDVKDLPKERNYQTVNDVISAFKDIQTKQKESLILQLLSTDMYKQYTPLADYINLLKTAYKAVDAKYWFATFSLYNILENRYRFSLPFRDMYIQTETLHFILKNVDQIKTLIINNDEQRVGHIQPDVSLEILLRTFKTHKNTFIFKQYQTQVQLLLQKLAQEEINYNFHNCISTLASPSTSAWIRNKMRARLDLMIKRNTYENFHIILPDWKNNTYIYIDLKALSGIANNIINAIKRTRIETIYQKINTMKNPTKKEIWHYLLRIYNLDESKIKEVKFIKMQIKGNSLLKTKSPKLY